MVIEITYFNKDNKDVFVNVDDYNMGPHERFMTIREGLNIYYINTKTIQYLKIEV